MVTKQVVDMTIGELCEYFEGAILYDAHSFRARYCRSEGGRELKKRGPSAIEDITTHLIATRENRSAEVKDAWTLLLNDICDAHPRLAVNISTLVG